MVRISRLLPLWMAAIVGCSADASVVAEPGNAFGPSGFEDFAGGSFQLYVQAVDDHCLDGALEVLFMPTGATTEYPLSNETFFPAIADLPQVYVMKLQTPFEDMSITMNAVGSGGMQVVDAFQDDVILDVPGSDDCTADIVFGAAVTLVSQDSITLLVTATLSDVRSPTETCPTLDTDPCEALLTMRGERR